MSKPRVAKVTYGEEMPKESALLFYSLIENLLLKSLPEDSMLKGMCLNSSFREFSVEERMSEIDKKD